VDNLKMHIEASVDANIFEFKKYSATFVKQ